MFNNVSFNSQYTHQSRIASRFNEHPCAMTCVTRTKVSAKNLHWSFCYGNFQLALSCLFSFPLRRIRHLPVSLARVVRFNNASQWTFLPKSVYRVWDGTLVKLTVHFASQLFRLNNIETIFLKDFDSCTMSLTLWCTDFSQ